jgi:hypothetical protein
VTLPALCEFVWVLSRFYNGRRTHNRVLSRSDEAEAYIAAEYSRDKVEPRYDWLYRYDALGVAVGES